MIISSEKKFIFVAIPKTGTSSIEKALGKYSDTELENGKVKHLLLKNVEDLLDKPYYKFCFFRNPWDRMVSLYHYHLRNNDDFLSRKYSEISFDEWIKKAYLSGILEKQTDYIAVKGKLIPDVAIYKFEEIDDAWKHICEKLDVEGKLPHINKTKHQHYSSYYTPETKHIVEVYCYMEIRMMGYEYESLCV